MTHSEQAKLLRRSPNGIISKNQWPAGPRVPGTKSKRVYVLATPPRHAAGYLKGRHSCHKPQPKPLLNAWLWRLWRAKHMAHQ
jgi:hypothetical protein